MRGVLADQVQPAFEVVAAQAFVVGVGAGADYEHLYMRHGSASGFAEICAIRIGRYRPPADQFLAFRCNALCENFAAAGLLGRIAREKDNACPVGALSWQVNIQRRPYDLA